MSKKLILGVVIALIALIATVTFFVVRSNSQKLRACPEAWYDNRMPGGTENKLPRQYLVYGGERKELAEVDIEWIENNCRVNEPQPVY
jgi:hypothetical protein